MQAKWIGVLAISAVLMGCNQTPKTSEDAKVTNASAATSASATSGSTLPADAQTYVMAVDGVSAPFAFKDEKGNLTGFDVELMRAIGEKQGFRVEVIAAPWSGIFNGLNENKQDIVGSAVTITPERQQQMDFSNSYLSSATIVATKDPAIQSFADLQGKKVGVQGGSYSEEVLKQANFPAENIVTYKTDFLLYQAMVKGEVAAIVDDSNITKSLSNQLKGLTDTSQVRILPLPGTSVESLGYAVKKGRNDLMDKINKGLEQVKGDGTYDKIYKKWFGDAPPAAASAPASATASSTQ